MTRRNILLFILILSTCIFVLIYVPKWQLLGEVIKDPQIRIELENKLRGTLSQILGGLFFLLGLYFAWRRITATEKSVSISEQGQITERFTRAIDQLGASENGKPKLEIRLGGIYALERIARESKEDHWPIMEVFTTYVRENVPFPPKANQTKEKGEGEAEVVKAPPQPVGRPKPYADIQAILNVIGRRSLTYKKGEDLSLDLSETDLKGYNIEGHLEEVNFTRANLMSAKLMVAYLKGANLGEANLVGANLMFANLMGANLEDANLNGADLRDANLMEANLERAEHLTVRQLCKAKTLYEVKLDDELKKQIDEKCPHLLEKPK